MQQTRKVALSVNVDHVATLREARQVGYPDPIDAARIAERCGASGITVHLRSDRRHICDDDVRRLRPIVVGKLNLEMAATPEMLEIAARVVPDQVTLVPERADEVTTEGGLDLLTSQEGIRSAAEQLSAAGIDVSLFIDPDSRQLSALEDLGTTLVSGFEINTDLFTRSEGVEARHQLEKVSLAAARGAASGFGVFAGHGLTTSNVGPIAAIPEIEELNIGHWLISRSVLVGLPEAIREMLSSMDSGEGQTGKAQ